MDRELADLHRGYVEEQRCLVPNQEPVEPEPRPTQVDLEGEAVSETVPRLRCAGTAGATHDPMIMSIARAGPPIELLCPRCEARYRVEEADQG